MELTYIFCICFTHDINHYCVCDNYVRLTVIPTVNSVVWGARVRWMELPYLG